MNLKSLTFYNVQVSVLVLASVCSLVRCELRGGRSTQGHGVSVPVPNPLDASDPARHQGPPENAVVVGYHPVSAVAVKDATSLCGTEHWCTSLGESELLALDAIRALHRQIDDDKNGNIDFDESDEFLREELMYEGDYEKRQRLLHQDDDNHVSVKELWDSWVRSEVHNWTTEQTIEWLSLFVGLPQYSKNFFDNSVNGSALPRLATNHLHVLSSSVGIKDLIHRQKIALKAQDVVLFGSPKDYGNRTKDSVLTTLLVLALMVCWFVFSRYKMSQRDLNRMIVDMESLAKAEQALLDLQKKLEEARTAQQEKALEAGFQRKLLDDGIPCTEEISRLKGEVEVLRNELQRAEVELQDKCWVPPPALQHWLQLTYELELKSYNRKRQSAEKQLKQAKDACDKLKKKRSSLMGAFVSTHGRSIDDVDKAILEARTALTEITQELQERMHRWKQIELLVNCPIMNNPGLPTLEAILRGIGRGFQFNGPGSVISNSQDDIDDDGASSIYCPSAVSAPVSSGSGVHMPIMRSKSVSSMISLREKAVSSRECSSKDSSTGEDEINMDMTSSEMTSARDRRVTFGIRTDHRELYSSVNQPRQLYKEEKQEIQTEAPVVPLKTSLKAEKECTNGIESNSRICSVKPIEEKNPPEISPLIIFETNMRISSITPVGEDTSPTHDIPKKLKEQAKIWKVLTKGFRHISHTNTKSDAPLQQLEECNSEKLAKEGYRSTFFAWSRRHLLKPSLRLSSHGKEKFMLPASTVSQPDKSG